MLKLSNMAATNQPQKAVEPFWQEHQMEIECLCPENLKNGAG